MVFFVFIQEVRTILIYEYEDHEGNICNKGHDILNKMGFNTWINSLTYRRNGCVECSWTIVCCKLCGDVLSLCLLSTLWIETFAMIQNKTFGFRICTYTEDNFRICACSLPYTCIYGSQNVHIQFSSVYVHIWKPKCFILNHCKCFNPQSR